MVHCAPGHRQIREALMRSYLSGILLLAAGSAWAQESPTETLVNPWYYCVGRVTGSQPDKLKSPEAAIERGFEGCKTEEAAVRSWGEMRGLSPAELNMAISSHKTRLKQALISSILKSRKP